MNCIIDTSAFFSTFFYFIIICILNKIRNFYIELEKLLIKYKDNIVNDLNNQIGIKTSNKDIIESNNKEGLIYVLKVSDEVKKIGNTTDIKKRMKLYNVGRINELPIVLVYKSKYRRLRCC